MTSTNQFNADGLQTRDASRSIAYLLSGYPILSMIFVVREVVRLRTMGFRVSTASINSPDRPADGLTEQEKNEAAQTYYIKAHGAGGAAAAHLAVLAGDPAGYLRGLMLLVRLAGPDLRRLFYHLMYFTEALMVGRWMRREQRTHLHCHLAQQAATVGLYVKRIFRFGYSITVHGPDEFYDARGQCLREKIAAADFIVCISNFARSQLMFLSPVEDWQKMNVVRLGVDTEHFAPQPRDAQNDCFEILCIGRLTPAKGQHLLIDAMETLHGAGRRARLRLVGTGADEASLRAHARRSAACEQIVFEGPVTQDHILAFYARADVFVLPSFAEGIPVVLMEAMAMGLPCIATYIAGIPELIRDNADGLLCAASDADGLARALARLMDEPELRQRLGASARKRIDELYYLDRNVESLARLFAEHLPR